MDENEKKVDGQEEPKTEPEQTAEETKAETKETQKAKKAEKPSVAKRAKSAVKRNKKPIIAGIVGFATGALSMLGGSIYLGHKQRKQEELAMREAAVPTYEPEVSPLDPNLE